MTTHERKLGDVSPLNSILVRDGTPMDLAGVTVKFQLETMSGTSTIAETDTGVTVHPTQTFTVDTTNNWVLKNDHGVQEGQQLIVSTTTTLPTGLAASTRYFAVNVQPNTFQVSLTPGGSVITISTAGSGTHSFYVVGSVQYVGLATVATAGNYWGWWTKYTGASRDTFPTSTEGIAINITPFGN